MTASICVVPCLATPNRFLTVSCTDRSVATHIPRLRYTTLRLYIKIVERTIVLFSGCAGKT